MYIDTHCHLNFKEYDADRAMVIGNAKKAGVKKFINPGVNLYFSRLAVDLAQKNPGVVFAGVGFHPYEAQHYPDLRELEMLLRSSASRIPSARLGAGTHHASLFPIVAVGECGLDYHMYKGEKAEGKKDNQKRLFEEQLLLALKYNLPVIIHSRDAFDDSFKVLDSLPQLPRGVFHCFSGGLQEVRTIKERKLFIGVDGNVTYAKQLQAIVAEIPLSMLLLETDAPYLTPVPHRGSRNEPKYLPLIAKQIAELQKIGIKEVQEKTTQNAQVLFGV